MGCDIHIAIQAQNADGAWVEIPWQRALYDHEIERGETVAPDIAIAPACFDGRNYNLFGILADVRNGYGFAGIETGTGWKSIAADRGLPHDFSENDLLPRVEPIWRDEREPRYLGDHSFTWVTLDELETWPWDVESALLYGCVPAEEYDRLQREGGIPTSYSGDVMGRGVCVYTPLEYEQAKSSNLLCERPYVRMPWARSAREATHDWPGEIIPWLRELAQGRPIRLVMGFDS